MWTEKSSCLFVRSLSSLELRRIHAHHIEQALEDKPKLLKQFFHYSRHVRGGRLKPYIQAAKENKVCPLCLDHFLHLSHTSQSSTWTPACHECMKTPEGMKLIRDKMASTCLAIYGDTSPARSNVVREKARQTCLKRYGVDNPSKSTKVLKRIRETMLRNHCVTHALKSKKLKAKMEATMMERFGVKNPNDSKKLQKKRQTTCLNKYGNLYCVASKYMDAIRKKASIKKYGVEYFVQAEQVKKKAKKTWLKKYGVDNPLKSSDIQLKVFESQHRIHEIKTDRKVYKVQGYERYIIHTLESKFDEVLCQFDKGFDPIDLDNGSRYFPDFYIPERDIYVEIKSLWTLFKSGKSAWIKNKYKACQCEKLGIRVKWSVVEFSNTPSYFLLPRDWYQMTYKQLESYCEDKVGFAIEYH